MPVLRPLTVKLRSSGVPTGSHHPLQFIDRATLRGKQGHQAHMSLRSCSSPPTECSSHLPGPGGPVQLALTPVPPRAWTWSDTTRLRVLSHLSGVIPERASPGHPCPVLSLLSWVLLRGPQPHCPKALASGFCTDELVEVAHWCGTQQMWWLVDSLASSCGQSCLLGKRR